MRNETFRSRAVESSLLLPLLSAVTLGLWLFESNRDVLALISLALIAITTYTIVEWNSQCQMLRIRSRMNSATFLAFISCFPTLTTMDFALVPALMLLSAFFVLFKAYGEYYTQGHVFHAFLFLGIGSLLCPPLILVYPTLLISCQSQLRILTFKAFVASMLGLLAPIWMFFATVYATAYLGKEIPISLPSIGSMPNYTLVPQWKWIVAGLIAAIGVPAAIHFVLTSYDDKIRTRQYYYTIMLQYPPLLFIAAWYPQMATFTLPLLVIVTTPFVARYLTSARSHSMRYIFVLWIVAFGSIAALNHSGIDMCALMSQTQISITSILEGVL